MEFKERDIVCGRFTGFTAVIREDGHAVYADGSVSELPATTVAYELVSRPEVEPQEHGVDMATVRASLPPGWTAKAVAAFYDYNPGFRLFAPDGRSADADDACPWADDSPGGTRNAVRHDAEMLSLPDPYAPQEPRPFVVGDRVRGQSGRSAVVLEVVPGRVSDGVVAEIRVDYEDGRNPDWRNAACFELITPASPIILEGDAAVLPVPETEPPLFPREYLGCMDCGCARESGCVLCTDCCTCSGVADNERCPTCGFGPLPALPRPYDEGGTNPAGFPTMPEAPGMSDAMAFVAEPENQSALTMSSSPVGGALVQEQLRRTVPLDCYLRDREAVRVWGEKLDAKHEAAEAGPRLGDLMTAWYQEEGKEPARLTGVLVEMEDRFITLRRSGRCNVCIRAGANVVTRKESM
jgi:hypothetical protein